MLDSLDQIPWSELSHAYGEATDVPELLRDLASPEKETREAALYSLYGNIWHQGTVYEATSYAAPFLIELLTIPSVEGKGEILRLLQALSQGSSYLDAHQHFDHYRNERETEEFQDERAQELYWVRMAHDAVVAGIPVYLNLLTHPDSEVRTMAPFVLASCRERREEIEPVLLGQAETETDSVAKASLLFSLTRFRMIQEPTAPHLPFLDHIDLSNNAPIVRFTAALSRVLQQGKFAIPEAMPIFRETFAECEESYTELPWDFGESPLFAVSAVLAPYPNDRLGWLLEMLENREPEVRKTAIYEIEEFARERRFIAREIVIPLARLLTDTDTDVRKQASHALPLLGKARLRAVPLLEAMQNHPDPAIQVLAQATLIQLQKPRDTYALKNWLKAPKEARSITDCIAVLESGERGPSCGDAATALEFIGPGAVEAVPALRNVLQRDSHWVRVRAARALWKITHDPTESLAALVEEIQCRPAGLLVLDCLGEMGKYAESVLPKLRQIVDSEIRLVELGSLNDWIDEDEAYQEAAKTARDRIQAAL